MTKEREAITKLFRKLCRQPSQEFPKQRKKLNASYALGVYIIRDPKGRVAHVGRTLRAKGGLHQRLNDHLYGRSSFVHDYLKGEGNDLRGSYAFQYLEVADPRKRALLEAFSLAWLCPLHIGLGEGENRDDNSDR